VLQHTEKTEQRFGTLQIYLEQVHTAKMFEAIHTHKHTQRQTKTHKTDRQNTQEDTKDKQTNTRRKAHAICHFLGRVYDQIFIRKKQANEQFCCVPCEEE
jgi:hypothetical protein